MIIRLCFLNTVPAANTQKVWQILERHCYNKIMNCPDCNAVLGITTKDEEKFFHIYEMCAYCGYIKAFVDYKDDDTGPIVWSGLDY
jgi:hypothetical protein